MKIIIQSVDNLREVVSQNHAAAGATKRVTDSEREKLNTELEKVRKLKKTIYEDYLEELISKEEYVTYRQDYLKKEEQLEKQLESLEKRPELATLFKSQVQIC